MSLESSELAELVKPSAELSISPIVTFNVNPPLEQSLVYSVERYVQKIGPDAWLFDDPSPQLLTWTSSTPRSIIMPILPKIHKNIKIGESPEGIEPTTSAKAVTRGLSRGSQSWLG
jgi:hypothetical protein